MDINPVTVTVRLLMRAITVYETNLPPFDQYKAQSYVTVLHLISSDRRFRQHRNTCALKWQS
jgi:hypothetical protein